MPADTKTTLTWELKDKVSGPARGIGGVLGGLASPLGLATVGVGALTGALALSVKSAADAQRIQAQTAAVIKSTGGAANKTADQIGDLATRISEYSGIEDDAVQEGENLLLTFTNIQDRAGEGNDIFTQATEIMADMATAMGTDMSSQAIQLGKALNDPVAGISALTRVGVTFTDEQKDLIARMVETGDTAGAQQVILAELTREFGGSAEAAGATADGGMQRLQNKIGELSEKIGTALLPFLETFVDFILTDVIPGIESFAGEVNTFVTEDLRGLWKMLNDVNAALATFERLMGQVQTKASGMVRGGKPTAPSWWSNLQNTMNQQAPPNRIPRAAGGPVEPFSFYRVGETGPETLITGPMSGRIIPGVSPMGGTPVRIPVFIDGRQVAEIVDEHLYYMGRMAAPVRTRF